MMTVRVRVAFLVFALLWAQWLGLSHAIWHSPLLRGAETHVSLPDKPAAKSTPVLTVSAGSLLSHDSEAQCRLFDQLAHSDALIPPALNWVGLPPSVTCQAHAPAAVQVRFALAYSARAPPPFLS